MHMYAYYYIYTHIVQNEVLIFFLFLSSQFLYQIKKLIHNQTVQLLSHDPPFAASWTTAL